MKSATVRKLYFMALFALLVSNGISGIAEAVGIHGFAFYHVQAAILCLCVVHVGLLVVRGRFVRRLDPVLFGTVLFSIAYAVVSGLLLLRFQDVSAAYVVLILHTLLFYPGTTLLLFACSSEDCSQEPADLAKWLPWACTLVILFGWIQFFAGDPLLQVTNAESESKLVASSMLGTFRPPSFFESSFQYGLFSTIVLCVSMASALSGNRRSWWITVLAASGVILSQTRNVYLCAVCAIISLLLLRRARSRRKGAGLLRWMPGVYFLSAIGVMAYAVLSFLRSGLERSEDLADASSTWARASSWQRVWETLVQPGSLFDVLFGYGITQAGHASDYRSLYPVRGDGLFIDSTFVNIFLLQGLIGLFLFLIIWRLIWRRLLGESLEHGEPLTVGVTAFFSAFLAAGVFNILNGQWWGVSLSLVFFILSNRSQHEHGYAASRTRYRALPQCC